MGYTKSWEKRGGNRHVRRVSWMGEVHPLVLLLRKPYADDAEIDYLNAFFRE